MVNILLVCHFDNCLGKNLQSSCSTPSKQKCSNRTWANHVQREKHFGPMDSHETSHTSNEYLPTTESTQWQSVSTPLLKSPLLVTEFLQRKNSNNNTATYIITQYPLPSESDDICPYGAQSHWTSLSIERIIKGEVTERLPNYINTCPSLHCV